MKTLTLTGLTLVSAAPALAHTVPVPHTHAEPSAWPVLIAGLVIALAAAVYVKGVRTAKTR